jgi:hypothetical protein
MTYVCCLCFCHAHLQKASRSATRSPAARAPAGRCRGWSSPPTTPPTTASATPGRPSSSASPSCPARHPNVSNRPAATGDDHGRPTGLPAAACTNKNTCARTPTCSCLLFVLAGHFDASCFNLSLWLPSGIPILDRK